MITFKISRYKKPTAKVVKQKKFVQFSKRCIVALTIMWFIGALFAFFVVAVQTIRNDMSVNLSDLLLYIGAPMTGGIVSYMLKTAHENKEKIKNSNLSQGDEII